MENKKIILLLLFSSIVIGCSNAKKVPIDQQCKNAQKFYKKTSSPVIYSDSLEELYLRVDNKTPSNWREPLSYCQKLPYTYINEVGLNNDSISTLKRIIDLNSFTRINGTKGYFYDKNSSYYYGTDPARWPLINEITIDISSLTVVDSLTIKDHKTTYYRGTILK